MSQFDITSVFFIMKAKGGFAVPALYTPLAGVSKEIPVVFDREGTTTTIGDTLVQNADPQAICRSDDMPDAESQGGASIIINTVEYEIKEAHADTEGMTVLILKKK